MCVYYILMSEGGNLFISTELVVGLACAMCRAGGCWPHGRQKPDCRASGCGWLQLGLFGGLSAGN